MGFRRPHRSLLTAPDIIGLSACARDKPLGPCCAAIRTFSVSTLSLLENYFDVLEYFPHVCNHGGEDEKRGEEGEEGRPR